MPASGVLLIYLLASLAEIGGCFAFWAWLRLGHSMVWVLPGTLSLLFFACLLTRIPAESAGRAYAAYGGIYILASLLWMIVVEKHAADRWDLLGVVLCLAGAAVIVFGPRAA